MVANTGVSILSRPTLLQADANCYLVVVQTANGVANTKKLSIQNLYSNNTTDIFIANTFIITGTQTPANSAALTIKKGTVFFDDNYLYVATANNLVKRSGSLSTF